MDKAQKNWLLETFFENDNFPGWRGVAEKLIDTGSCITTNYGENIWVGGIGNFINSENYEGGIDLIKLSFNVKEFASVENLFFLEEYQKELKRVSEEQQKLIDYSNSIKTLTEF